LKGGLRVRGMGGGLMLIRGAGLFNESHTIDDLKARIIKNTLYRGKNLVTIADLINYI